MLKIPNGIIKVARTGDSDYQGIEIVIVTKDGHEDRIALVEYQKEENIIATYTYEDGREEFVNKTIYKGGIY